MVVLLLLEGALLAAQPTLESASASDDPQPEHPPTELRLVLEDAPAGFNESFRDALSKQNIEATSEEIDGTLTLTIKPWSGPGVDGFSYELALSREGERVGEVFSQVCVGCDGPALALEAADRAIVMTERLPRREKPRVPELVEEVSLAPAMPIPFSRANSGWAARRLATAPSSAAIQSAGSCSDQPDFGWAAA